MKKNFKAQISKILNRTMLNPNINMVWVLTKYTNTGLNANKRGLEVYGITDTTTTRLYKI